MAFFVSIAEMLSVPKSLAAIYGILFASPVPLTFTEIEARLDLSKGSVSQGLRALREVGAVTVVGSEQGNGSKPPFAARRADAYAPDTEMRRVIAHFLESRVETQLKSSRARFKNFQTALGAFPEAQQKVLRPRVQKLQRWHDRTQALLPVIRTFLKLGG